MTTDVIEVQGSVDGLSVRLNVSEGTLAGGELVSSDASLTDSFAAFLEHNRGFPLYEAADHGALRAMSATRRAVDGIALPQNYDATLATVQRLVRAAYADYVKRTGFRQRDNTFVPNESASWHALDSDKRLQAVAAELPPLLESLGFTVDDVTMDAIDDRSRFTVHFSSRVPVAEKPALLMHLERMLRDRLDRSIELFVAEVKDENALRRL